MVLLLGPHFLFVKLVAHPVEQLYDPVCIRLPYLTQSGGEILLFKQVDAFRESA